MLNDRVAAALTKMCGLHDPDTSVPPKVQSRPENSRNATSPWSYDTDQKYARACLLEEPKVLDVIDRDFIKRILATGEENAVFNVSQSDFCQWESKKSALAWPDERYCEYNAVKSEFIIKADHGPIHEGIVKIFGVWLRDEFKKKMKEKLVIGGAESTYLSQPHSLRSELC